MTYRLTVLTPLLVGDGQKLAPIDYMVWKDQINVLDQRRIFRLLAKGPRLENYLAQIRRAERLDFASWGGFAQNFAGRRVPFEHPSSSSYWEQARAESLHIPTFCSGTKGAFLPGSAIKGALRTGVLFSRWNPGVLREIASRIDGDRPPRRPGEAAEAMTIGPASTDPLRLVSSSDSAPAPQSAFKIYLLRVASLESRGSGKFDLAWKQVPRGSVPGQKPEQSTPLFAEMASPGTVFTGGWNTREFLKQPEIAKILHWRESFGMGELLQSANAYADGLLAAHRQYAEKAGLQALLAGLDGLGKWLNDAKGGRGKCLLSLGWGGGFLSKVPFLETENEDYRKILRQMPFYERAIRSGLPFPKTRRIVFLQNQAAALPGWGLLEID